MPVAKPRRRLLINDELAQQLRDMREVAAKVNGGMDPSDPARRVAEDFAAALAALVEQGVSRYTIAQTLGISLNAVSFRLGRHGYGELPPSQRRFPYRNRKVGADLAETCRRGHPRSEYLIVRSNGRRDCRACTELREERRRNRAGAA